MSNEPNGRSLSPEEKQVMELVNTWNKLADQGRQVGTLTMTADGATTLIRHRIAQPYKTESTETERVRLYFTMREMEKYLYFACKQVGFTLLLNGGVKTKDGLFVDPTPVDLNPEKVFS